MIDGIRRRLAKSIEKDPWDAHKEFEPEIEVSAVSTDTAVLVAATSSRKLWMKPMRADAG